MRNYKQPGETITVPAPATVTSGLGTIIGGSLFGVAKHDAASGADCSFLLEGVVELPKLSTAVIAVGDRLNWDHTNARFIKTAATGDILNVAVAVSAAGNPSATVNAKLTPDSASVSA
jgi:predicted RecA/RadA family phage recombinase